MIEKKVKPVFAVAFLILFYSVGIAGLLLPSFHDLFVNLTPVSLLLSFILLLLYHQKWSFRIMLYSLVVFLAGFLIEAAGVATGVIFGEYVYGSVLGPKILETPLMIGVNWLMLTYTTWDLVGRIRVWKAGRIIIASMLMVLIDLFLEPVAMKMGMWDWPENKVPVQNYAAWFAVSFLFFSLAALLKIEFRNKVAIPLWIILLIFFILLNVFNI